MVVMIVGLPSCCLVDERNNRLGGVAKVQFHFPGKLLDFDLFLKDSGE